jgi:AraC-like DNA-binding protein
MLTKESIYVIFFSLPVYQLLFYTVQLVSFKRKNPSKKYLGLLLLCMTTFLVLNAIYFLGYDSTFSHLYFLYLPVLLTIAPTYFLYILSITRDNHDVNKRERLILFSPAIALLLANLVLLVILTPADRLRMIDHDILNKTTGEGNISSLALTFWISTTLLVFGQMAFAIARVSKIMLTEAELMRKQPSHLAYLNWRWILGISFSVLIFLVINSLVEMILPMKHLSIVVVYNVLMLLCGGITGYLGMKQDTLLKQVEKLVAVPPNHKQETNLVIGAEKKGFIPGNFISANEAGNIHRMILDYLESEKPFIRSDFSMHDLCAKLNISRRKASYVLNEVICKNFYGVVNEYRVKEAEELLMDDGHNQLKIEALGEMVGFQSKSSFNACFKKMTGMTPSEYRLKHRA